MLGDLNIAEPGALIGFAGPRVIEQTSAKSCRYANLHPVSKTRIPAAPLTCERICGST